MPKTYFELPPDQGKTKLYVTWRDRRGEEADIVTINFDPQAALAESEKQILEVLWTAWIDLRDWNGAMLVYFSHLITYRCAIQEVRYGYNGGTIDQIYKLAPRNILDPNSVPEDAKIYERSRQDAVDAGAAYLPRRNPVSGAELQRPALSAFPGRFLLRLIAAVGTQCPRLGASLWAQASSF